MSITNVIGQAIIKIAKECVDLLVQRIFSDFCIDDKFSAFRSIEDEHANTDFKNLQGEKKVG